MILCIGPTPAAQRVMVFPHFEINEVNRATVSLDGVAGKGVNVAKVLKSLGERPIALGFAGGERGNALRRTLEQREIDCEFIDVAAPTRQCTTVIDERAGTQTELVEESGAVPTEAYQQLLAAIQHRIAGARAMVMSGTITPGGPEDFYERCVQIGRQRGILTVVDAKAALLTRAIGARPGLVKPNRKELEATLGRQLADSVALFKGMQELVERGAERVVVTSGKDPAIAFDGKSFWKILPPSIQALNPIGSGDAFTAGLVWRLMRGEELGEACRWGAACGAANALSLAPGELDPQDVERLVRNTQIERASAAST